MSGWDAAAAGIDPERVAELLVTPANPGPGRRGSGYRISASAVLTAAHVVRDAAEVRVRFNADRPGEWITNGTIGWSDPTIDVAIIAITPRPQDEGQVAPVGFGRVAERDAVLACSAIGFPQFKLRRDPARPLDDDSPSLYRDWAHAVGTIAVLSNRREGTLEVTVSPPERDPDPKRSPWEGMSGAALWSAGRIIGLVAEHHRSDGPGRLAATRVDRWYERLSPDRLEELRTLIGLPTRWYELRDVVPSTAEELLEAGYIAQVRDIAPEQLLGRDKELAELVQFCAGEERYQWWRADAWAGKSALAAWFVLRPPAGVSVVSFFVTGRLAGQADSDAFDEAMVEQLAAVAGESIVGSATPAGRDRERRRLLDQAARRVGERQRRLLLVVDGLDEDVGAKPGSGKPSIASLLPKRPSEAVRVLVTSRRLPGIPSDVPGDHPLRRCEPRPLAPSPFARDMKVEAKDELTRQLHGGNRLQVDILGLITAAGGGLTLGELRELTGEPEWTLEGELGSVFGRSLKTRTPRDPPSADQADRVYLFAHETLRAIAEEELARDLGPYRRRIDDWANDYRVQGWPEGTPRYLLRPYGRMLAAAGDLQQLVAVASDPKRHDRMLAYTYGDAAALAEIATAQQLLRRQPIPRLDALGRLAVYRDRLANRNQAIPRELPAVWARLGQTHRAEALARSITDRHEQALVLAAVAKALAGTDPDRALRLAAAAEQTARTITDPVAQAEALAAVAEALTQAGQWDHAEQTARTITDPDQQAQALTAVAGALAGTDRDRAAALATDAEQTARTITDPDYQARALTAVAKALAQAGQWDHAQQTAHTITNPNHQAEAYLAIAAGLAAAPSADGAGGSEPLHVRACQLLADVLSGESWLKAIELLGKLDPVGAVAISEALDALNSG